MNAVTHFDFKSSSVRIVLDDNGEPLFCLADVYKALDISRTSRLFRELDPKGVADYHTPDQMLERIYLNILKCFITQNEDMVPMVSVLH